MGNRAVITSVKKDLAVYLHWNGGLESVTAFLDYCDMARFRSPDEDCYGYARLCQVIANFFGPTGLSVGVMQYTGDRSMCEMASDNGVYVVKGWKVVERLLPWGYVAGCEMYDDDVTDMLIEIDKCQPEDQRFGEEFITAEVVPSEELKVGDKVFVQALGKVRKVNVVGIKDGIPCCDLYFADGEGDYTWNPNNFLRGERYRLAG